MIEVAFDREDINELAEKIANRLHDLSPFEHALLLAIFAAAADRAEHAGDHRATLPASQFTHIPLERRKDDDVSADELHRQLLEAFTPGNDFDSVVASAKIVGPPPKIIGPPPRPADDK
jgi:hypothetical protein